MRSPRPRLAWLALVPLLAASACGSPAPPLPKVDACVLLPKDDAQAITGVPMVATFGSARGGGEKTDPGECVYASSGNKNLRRLGLSVQAFESHEEAAHIFDLTTAQLPGFAGQAPQEIPGLADRAVWAGGQLNKLFLLRGRYRLTIGSMGADADSSLAAAKNAATRALARLPG
jgi:hypothetical protein